jgi:putative endonuclease
MVPTINSQDIGKIGESLAVRYLQSKGYRIIKRNYGVPGIGEVDIIAYRRGTFFFVEVKASATYALNQELHPVKHFDEHKKNRTASVMRKYCMEHNIQSPRTVSFLAISFSRETLEAHVIFEPYTMLDTV